MVSLQRNHLGYFSRVIKQYRHLGQRPIVKQEILDGSIEAASDDRFRHIVSASRHSFFDSGQRKVHALKPQKEDVNVIAFGL